MLLLLLLRFTSTKGVSLVSKFTGERCLFDEPGFAISSSASSEISNSVVLGCDVERVTTVLIVAGELVLLVLAA